MTKIKYVDFGDKSYWKYLYGLLAVTAGTHFIFVVHVKYLGIYNSLKLSITLLKITAFDAVFIVRFKMNAALHFEFTHFLLLPCEK